MLSLVKFLASIRVIALVYCYKSDSFSIMAYHIDGHTLDHPCFGGISLWFTGVCGPRQTLSGRNKLLIQLGSRLLRGGVLCAGLGVL